MGYVTRRTVWADAGGNPIQVAVAQLDPMTWEELSCAVERLGPFDDVDDAWRLAEAASVALRDGHYRGQQFLPI